MLYATYRQIRRIVVLLAGLSVLLVGIAMLVLPGPAFIVIPLGLAILATEFVWAARLLRKMKQQVEGVRNHISGKSKIPADTSSKEKQDV